jgi:hypothetical protein
VEPGDKWTAGMKALVALVVLTFVILVGSLVMDLLSS